MNKINKIFNQINAEVDPKKRNQLYKKLNKKTKEQMGKVFEDLLRRKK